MIISVGSVPKEQIIDVLEKARDRITPESAWTKNTMARDYGGGLVSPHSVYAVKWCMSGAVVVTTNGIGSLYSHAIDALSEVISLDLDYANPVATFNDDKITTHADVIAVFNKAIAKLEESK